MLYTQDRPISRIAHFMLLITPSSIPHLVMSSLLLWLLLKPINLLLSNSASFSLSLNINSLGLVCLQFIRDIGFFGGLGWLWCVPFLDVTFGVGGFDGGGFVGFQLLEVEVLDEIRWREVC